MSTTEPSELDNQRPGERVRKLERELEEKTRKIEDMKQNRVLEMKRLKEDEQAKWNVEKEAVQRKAWNQAKAEYLKTAENNQREHKAEIASLTRDHENDMKEAKANWIKERNHLQEQAEVEKEKMRLELEKKKEHDIDKLKQELFIASQSQQEAEAHSADLEKEKGRLLEDLREMRKQHQNEIDAITKQSKTDSRKEFAELKELQQKLQSKEKELADMNFHCSQLENKCEQLEADALLNKSGGWGSLSSTPRRFGSEQSLPDDQEYPRKRTEKEEQLLIRNSELALLNRNLHDDRDRLQKEKLQLQKEKDDVLKEVEPLRKKQSDHLHRVQELRNMIADRDKQLQKAMEEVKETKEDRNKMEKQFVAEKERSRSIDRRTTEQLRLKHLLQEKEDTIQQLQEKIKSLIIDKKLLEDDKDRAKKERVEARQAQVSPLRLDSSVASRKVQERKRVHEMEQELESQMEKITELKRHKARLEQRVEDLNTSLKRRDRQAHRISTDNNSLKSANQSLEEQLKLSQQRFADELSHARAEVDQANAKINQLQSKNSDLKEKIQRMSTPSPPPLVSSPPDRSSPYPPPFSEDDFGSQWSLASTVETMSRQQQMEQLEYDKDELDIKYNEMKAEYRKICSNYTQLRRQYKLLLAKSRTASTRFSQVHMEHLQLQKEMAMLQQRGDGLTDFDVKREESLKNQLLASNKRLANVERILAQYNDELIALKEHQGMAEMVMNGIVGTLQEGEEEQSDETWLLETDANKGKDLVGLQLSHEEHLVEGRPPKREEEIVSEGRLSDNYANKQKEEVGLRDGLLTANKRVMAAEQMLLQQIEELKALKLLPPVTEGNDQDGNKKSQETQTSFDDDQLQNVSKKLAEMEELYTKQCEELDLLKEQQEQAEQARHHLEQSLLEMEGHLEEEKATSLTLKEEQINAQSLQEELQRLQMELAEERQKMASFDTLYSLPSSSPSLPSIPLSHPPTAPPPPPPPLSPTLQPKLADCLVSALSVTSELDRVLGLPQASSPSRTAVLTKQLQMVIGEAQDMLSGTSTHRQISQGSDELDVGHETAAANAGLSTISEVASMGDKFQGWFAQFQSENRSLKSQVRELEARLVEGSQRVLDLQNLVGELEGRLTAEQSLQSSILTDPGEQLSPSHQISRLQQNQSLQLPVPSPLARPTAPSPFAISPLLGQRVLAALKQVQQASRESHAEQLQQKLTILENAIQDLLQAVYQGRLSYSPTSAELASGSIISETPISPLSTTMDSSIQCTPPPLLTTGDKSPPPSLPHANPPLHPHSSPSPPYGSNNQWTSGAHAVSSADRLPSPAPPTPRDEMFAAVPLPTVICGRERLFVVLFDYDPQSLCSTGHPERELSLCMGSVIAVHGDMDDNGYYMATFEGKTGLVPAHFIQEMKMDDKKAHKRLLDQHLTSSFPSSLVESDVEIGLPYEGPKSLPSAELMHSITSVSADSATRGPHHPAPPTNLQVIRPVGSNALFLGWDLPEMDLHGQSHGFVVAGYQLFVDGIAREKVKSLESKIVVKNVDSSQPHTLSICTLSEEGPSSQLVTTHHHVSEQAVLRHPGITKIQQTASARSSTDSDVLNTKLMEALYDYDPSVDSPNQAPHLELMFKKGQVITIYGDMNDDGFYCGEVGGHFGLVPSNFVQEIGMDSNASGSRPFALMPTQTSPELDYKRQLFSSKGIARTSTPSD